MRLIDADALLEEIREKITRLYGYEKRAIENLITNAPAIEQGKIAAWIDGEAIITKTYMHYGWVDSGRAIPDCWIPLYTAPPQSQIVKDALEKAARIVQAKIGHYYPTPLTDAVTEIRALIEKE